MSAVLPSFRVTTGVRSVTGRDSLYLSMTPFHLVAVMPASPGHTFDPQTHRLLAYDIEVVDGLQRALHIPFYGLVGHHDDRHRALFLPAFLDDRDDTDIIVPQDPRDFRKHFRLVHRHETP